MSESLTKQRNAFAPPNTLHGRAIRRASRDISAQKWSTRQTDLFLVPALWRAHRRFVFQDREMNVAHTAEQLVRVYISRSRQPVTVQYFPITKHLTQPPDSTCEQSYQCPEDPHKVEHAPHAPQTDLWFWLFGPNQMQTRISFCKTE